MPVVPRAGGRCRGENASASGNLGYEWPRGKRGLRGQPVLRHLPALMANGLGEGASITVSWRLNPTLLTQASHSLTSCDQRLTARPSNSAERKPGGTPERGESQASTAVTVVWMLTCLSTAAALLVVFGLWLLARLFPPAADHPHPFTSIAAVLLLVAVATGVLCLLFTPLAARVRQSPAPRSITISAVLIGLAPLVTIVVKALLAK